MRAADEETGAGQGGRFSSVLFVVVFCYFWIGLSPLPDPRAARTGA